MSSLNGIQSELKTAFNNEDEAAFNRALEVLDLLAGTPDKTLILPDGWVTNKGVGPPASTEYAGSPYVKILTRNMVISQGYSGNFRWSLGYADDILAYCLTGR